jgi:hypothetical protein
LCVRLLRESQDELGCEDALGQAAVAYVMLNRVRSPDYPDTICGVVWQKGQGSWTEDGRHDRLTDLDALDRAVIMLWLCHGGRSRTQLEGHCITTPITKYNRAGQGLATHG